jgi:transcriptional regulator with XRE-family HTH domain
LGLKENINKFRISNNMTLEDVSNKLGISKTTLQRYESGVITNIPSEKVEKLSKVFKVTPSELMGWNDLDLNDEKEYIQNYRNRTTTYVNIYECLSMYFVGIQETVENILNATDLNINSIDNTVFLISSSIKTSILKDLHEIIFTNIKSTIYGYITDSWKNDEKDAVIHFNSMEVNKHIKNFSSYIDKTIKEIVVNKTIECTLEFIDEINKNSNQINNIKTIVDNNLVNNLVDSLSKAVKHELFKEIRLEVIIDDYHILNEAGQEKVLQYIEDLYENNKYRRKGLLSGDKMEV